jgi:hypothetical protein
MMIPMGSGDDGALLPVPGEVAARVLRAMAADLEVSRSQCHLEVTDRGGSRSVTIVAIDRVTPPGDRVDLSDVDLDAIERAVVVGDTCVADDLLMRAVCELRRRRAEDSRAFDRDAATVVERMRAPLLGVAGDDDVP